MIRPIRYIARLLPLLLIAGGEAVLAQGAEPADDFDRYILQQLDEAGVPGAAVVVSHRGEVLFARGYGFANVEWQAEATARTVFEIASVTKLFTALSAMMLVEDGLLDLDRSISRYIEETPQSHSAITARHLLTHTAGLESSYYDPQKLLAPAPLRYTVEAQLADLFAQPLKSKPGTAHEYGDASMFLLGVVIARSSGLTYEEFVRSRILEPAGMTQTSFIDAERVIPQRAQGYTLRRSSLVRWSIGGTMQALDQNAFAGILSTAWDLNLFHEALREGRLIGQETEDAMLELHRLPDGSYVDAGYSRIALGWWVRDIAGNRCASHLGHTGSAFFHCDDFAVVVLSNLTKGYEMLGDQGFPASVRHGIAERAVETFLNDGKH